jgi:hypothetical protein
VGGHDLAGAEAKLRRAELHFHTLDALVVDFRTEAYAVQPENDWTKGQTVIFAEPLREPPSLYWGPIIGDFVHNIRSALDHLVFALAAARKGPPPELVKGTKWERLSFPIRLDDTEWNSIRCDRLWALSDRQAAAIYDLQPFTTGQNAPEREPLAMLEELWNIDKHRHLHLINATVELAEVISVRPREGFPDITLKVVWQRAPGPLKERAEIARIEQVGVPMTNMPENAYGSPLPPGRSVQRRASSPWGATASYAERHGPDGPGDRRRVLGRRFYSQ